MYIKTFAAPSVTKNNYVGHICVYIYCILLGAQRLRRVCVALFHLKHPILPKGEVKPTTV